MTDTGVPDPVLYETAGGVARIRLNRPEALNSVNRATHDALAALLERAGSDDAVRVVVLSGSERVFSAGGDVKAMAAGEDVGHPSVIARLIWEMPKPVVAVVQGYCIGQGFELAGVCDLLIAGESARFGELEINHGWSPPIAITPHSVGLKAAKAVLLMGELHDADWALRTGFANWVVPDEDVEAELARVTERLVSLDAEALARNKRLVNEASGFQPE